MIISYHENQSKHCSSQYFAEIQLSCDHHKSRYHMLLMLNIVFNIVLRKNSHSFLTGNTPFNTSGEYKCVMINFDGEFETLQQLCRDPVTVSSVIESFTREIVQLWDLTNRTTGAATDGVFCGNFEGKRPPWLPSSVLASQQYWHR